MRQRIQNAAPVFGVNEKKDPGTAAGIFGEGIKRAALELARSDRKLHIDTVGFSIDAIIEHDQEFDADLMVLMLSQNRIKKGTRATFKCSEKEFEII
jgi:hypothetical protein